MIPDYIADEINRRLLAANLHRSKAKAVCRTVGIDLDRALEALTMIDDDVAKHRELMTAGPVHEGAVWFSFVTGAEGAERRVRGRIVFVTTPYGVDGTLGHMVTISQALIWRDGEPAPIWQHIPEEMLPVELVAAAYDEIDALATAKAIAAKSNA